MKFKLGDHIQQIPTADPHYPSLGYGVITSVSDISHAYLIKINDYNGGERWYIASDIDSFYVLYDSPEGVFYRL